MSLAKISAVTQWIVRAITNAMQEKERAGTKDNRLGFSSEQNALLAFMALLLLATWTFFPALQNAQYQQGLALDPDLADTHNNLAAALTRKGRLDEAITHLREAIRLKPDSAEAQKNLDALIASRQAAENRKSAP